MAHPVVLLHSLPWAQDALGDLDMIWIALRCFKHTLNSLNYVDKVWETAQPNTVNAHTTYMSSLGVEGPLWNLSGLAVSIDQCEVTQRIGFQAWHLSQSQHARHSRWMEQAANETTGNTHRTALIRCFDLVLHFLIARIPFIHSVDL